MQCSRCGAPVQPGMAFCPNCGQPYAAAQNAPIPPTQYAGPSSADQQAAQQYAPSANPYAPQAPAPYETPGGYGAPPPPNPYGAQSAYGTPPPPNAYNNAQSPYGTPPPPNYGAPYAPTPGAFTPQGQPPRKKGPNVGLIIGIVALLLVLIVGGVLAFKGLNHSGGQTNTNTPTVGTTSTTGATTTPASGQTPSPSGSPINTGAAAIITNVQTTSGIDANLLPTHPTNQFKVGDVVYVTYNLKLTQSGYVEAKIYVDGIFGTKTSLAVQVGKYDHGYFKITYKQASQGAFELYWCTQSDCSDEQLAAVATFTVS